MKTASEMRLYKREWARKKQGVTFESLIRSNTWKGREWEKRFSRLLGAIDMNAEVMGSEYDLDWNGNKINLKVSELYKRKMKRGKPTKSGSWWTFHREKTDVSKCDNYLLVCLENGEPVKTYMVPHDVFPLSGSCIGHNSKKYEKFTINITT